MSQNKKIILLVPINFGFNEIIKENAEYAGFKVISLTEKLQFKYSSIWEKLTNLYQKSIKKNYQYKNELKVKFQRKILQNEFSCLANNKTDYALFIRPDLWHYDIVATITQFAKYSICYQWDGLERYPIVQHYFHLFDKVILFDKNDFIQHPQYLLGSNFYFDCMDKHSNKLLDSIYYIGTYNDSRINKLKSLSIFFEQNSLPYTFKVFFDNKHESYQFNSLAYINILVNRMTYKEMFNDLKLFNIVLDLKNQFHQGLSFRAFECLYLEKKLITDNETIIDYDFFHPNNIFILKNENLYDLIEFFKKPYYKIDKSIIEKYSFSNWLNRILDKGK